MPKIKAESVAEHVEHQRAAVRDAATRLFVTRGYSEVSLADVAAEVGLARNSLYRYVPDKSHLLVEWYRDAVPRVTSVWKPLLEADGPPAERIIAWADAFLSWARTPEHDLITQLTEVLPSLPVEVRAEIAALHESMFGTVAEVLTEAGIPTTQVPGVVRILSHMVQGAARAATEGELGEEVRDRLDAAIRTLVVPAPRR